MPATLTLSDGVTTLVLPDLIWQDESDWDPIVQARTQSLSGALLLEEATRTAGRPVTLSGGQSFAWMTRAAVAAIRALGAVSGVELTLVLLNNTAVQCTPRRDGPGGAWLEVHPLPVVLDSGVVDYSDTTRYVVDRIRLVEV